MGTTLVRGRRFYDGWLDAAPRDPFYAPSARL